MSQNDPLPNLLPVQDIQRIIEPHARRFGRSIWPIWSRYLEIPELDRFTYNRTAEANVLNRYMIDYAKQEFSGVPGVSFFEQEGFVVGIDGFPFGINGQLACRLKKMDESGKSRNNLSTARARALRSNSAELLAGAPPEATWVDVGYVLNGLRTGIADVQVVRLAGTAFVMNIPREEDGSVTMPMPFEPAPSQPRFFVVRRREQNSDPESDNNE